MEGTAERTRVMPGFAGPAHEEKSLIQLQEKLSKPCPAGFDFQILTLETPYVNSIPPPSARVTNWVCSAKPSTAKQTEQAVPAIPSNFTSSKV